jgi:Tol biopolymer transport system component
MSRRDAVIAAVLALLALALGAGAFLADRSAAAWPGRSGPIVFVGVRQGDHRYSYETTRLKVLEPGVPGSTRQLTSNPTDADPQISPDGRLVVFSRETGVDEYGFGTASLFVIGIDGSGLRQLTAGGPGGGGDFKPAFYPSGESVVFARGSGATGENDLYSIRLDGSGLRQLTRGPNLEEAPAVSPSGRQIAFACGRASGNARIEDICSIRPDGTHRRVLSRGLKQGSEPFDPDFSPSGHLIAFTLGPGVASDVFTMRANGSRLGALTNRSPQGRRSFVDRESGYASPSFAPGGKELVAVGRPGAGPRLVRIPLRDPRHPKPLGAGFLGSAPVWAPG